jgi:hypothetical protein
MGRSRTTFGPYGGVKSKKPISFRPTEKERDKIEMLAQAEGKTVGEWVSQRMAEVLQSYELDAASKS